MSSSNCSILNAPSAKGQQPTANKKEVQPAIGYKPLAKSLER